MPRALNLRACSSRAATYAARTHPARLHLQGRLRLGGRLGYCCRGRRSHSSPDGALGAWLGPLAGCRACPAVFLLLLLPHMAHAAGIAQGLWACMCACRVQRVHACAHGRACICCECVCVCVCVLALCVRVYMHAFMRTRAQV